MTGLEPAASALTGRRSPKLSYTTRTAPVPHGAAVAASSRYPGRNPGPRAAPVAIQSDGARAETRAGAMPAARRVDGPWRADSPFPVRALDLPIRRQSAEAASGRSDSNRRPPRPERGALPGCATTGSGGHGPRHSSRAARCHRIQCSHDSPAPQQGLEPRSPDPESDVLPIAPPGNGRGGGTRTHDLLVPNQAPLPLGYTPSFVDDPSGSDRVRPEGLEPSPSQLRVGCSTS